MKIQNLLIADDHALLIDGIVATLKEKFTVENIVTCNSPEDAVKHAKEQEFDLYILDLGLRTESNIDIRRLDYIQKIWKIREDAKIVVYTMREDFAIVSLLSKLECVKSIVLKGSEREYLQKAVMETLNGGSYLCPRFKEMHKKSEEYRRRLQRRKLVNGLPTEKEIEILRLMAMGQTSEMIADTLGHTTSTIESYRRDLKQKFNTPSTIDMILLAILLNYISLEDVALDLLKE